MQDTIAPESEHTFDDAGDRWMTATEVIEEFGIARRNLTAWYQRGILTTRYKNGSFWMYRAREVSDAYWSSTASIIKDDDLIDEVNFFRSFGKTWEAAINEVAESLGMESRTIQERVIDLIPEVRKRRA